jgi:hypothetical protein
MHVQLQALAMKQLQSNTFQFVEVQHCRKNSAMIITLQMMLSLYSPHMSLKAVTSITSSLNADKIPDDGSGTNAVPLP